jgi:PEP-CTERM motif
MNARFLVLVSLILLTKATALAAVFMDLTSVAPGPFGAGGFTGTLAGVGVTGTFGGGAGNTVFNAAGPGIGFSTTDGSSPQWSHAPIYTPAEPFADRVGFSQTPGGSALVTVGFSSPMTDLVFHIANLDLSSLDFSPSGGSGLTGMTLLSGNGGGGDGLGVSPPLIFDAAAGADFTAPSSPPPIAGPRSAYGSVLLSGTYSTISFVIIPGGGIDDANFTFSTPEPSMTTLGAIGLIGIVFRRRRRAD